MGANAVDKKSTLSGVFKKKKSALLFGGVEGLSASEGCVFCTCLGAGVVDIR